MALNAYGLQCLTFILSGLGVIVIVWVFVLGAARLLADSIELPDGWQE